MLPARGTSRIHPRTFEDFLLELVQLDAELGQELSLELLQFIRERGPEIARGGLVGELGWAHRLGQAHSRGKAHGVGARSHLVGGCAPPGRGAQTVSETPQILLAARPSSVRSGAPGRRIFVDLPNVLGGPPAPSSEGRPSTAFPPELAVLLSSWAIAAKRSSLLSFFIFSAISAKRPPPEEDPTTDDGRGVDELAGAGASVTWRQGGRASAGASEHERIATSW